MKGKYKTMENSNTEMQFNEEEVRAGIEKEVLAELETKNIRVIPNYYSWQENILEIVEEYDKLKTQYDKALAYNKNRYAEHLASEMNRNLTNDFNEEVNDLYRKLDDIQETDYRWRMHHVQKMQESEEYQAQKATAFQEISYLKGIKQIPVDLLQDIVAPVIEAYDTRSLRIMSVMLGSEQTIPGRLLNNAISSVNAKLNTTESEAYIRACKQYIQTNELNLLLMSLADKVKK